MILNKKWFFIILSLIFAAVLVMGQISAADNSTFDVGADDNQNIICAEDNSDVVGIDDNQSKVGSEDNSDDLIGVNEDLDNNSPSKLSSNENCEVLTSENPNYYEQGIIKPAKLTTSYRSGKSFNVKLVTKGDSSNLVGVKVKARVFTGNKYQDFYAYTGSDGYARFKLSWLSLGSHKVVVSSADSDVRASSVSSVIKINKANTNAKAPAVSVLYKNNGYFKITVTHKESKQPVPNLAVKVKVFTGKRYKVFTVKTNSKGVATLNTKNFVLGDHKTVLSSGSGNYNLAGTTKIVVKKPLPSVTLKIKSSKYYHTIKRIKRDVIYTFYEDQNGRQSNPGVHVGATLAYGLEDPVDITLVKAKFWFKHKSTGKIITKVASCGRYGIEIPMSQYKGYVPYQTQVWFRYR